MKWIAIFTLIVALVTLPFLFRKPELQHRVDVSYEHHMNDTIAWYCDFYRVTGERSQESLKRELERMMQSYDGPLTIHSEYCLNAMDVEYNRR